jgi:hypothetical protein
MQREFLFQVFYEGGKVIESKMKLINLVTIISLFDQSSSPIFISPVFPAFAITIVVCSIDVSVC